MKAGVLEGSSDSEEEVHVYKLKIHDTDVKDAGEWRVEVADKYGSTSTACNLAIRGNLSLSLSLHIYKILLIMCSTYVYLITEEINSF